MSSSSSSALRPAWKGSGGKGFQPPPQISDKQKEEEKQTYNTFAALDEDDDDAVLTEAAAAASAKTAASSASGTTANSRSEALRQRRSTKSRSASTGGGSSSSVNASSNKGRSLAELASRAPVVERATSTGGGTGTRSSTSHRSSTGGATNTATKAAQFTRERLLSMRPTPRPSPTDQMARDLAGSVILSDVPQDPVCWDTFDAEEIWATASTPSQRRSVSSASIKGGGPLLPDGLDRRSSGGPRGRGEGGGIGRWQRGVALPPEGTKRSSSRSEKDADDPNDLWDDPVVSTDAAADFSAFGAMPPDDNEEAFDFEKMAEASRKLEEEMHPPTRSRASSTVSTTTTATDDDNKNDNKNDNDKDNDNDEKPQSVHTTKIDPRRPLASVGTTIRSGSGDNVNVFEDFDDPAVVAAAAAAAAAEDNDPDKNGGETAAAAASQATIKAADEDPSASSRLMAMIGVKKEVEAPAVAPKEETAAPAGATTTTTPAGWGEPSKDPAAAVNSALAGIPLNPWGDPILTGGGAQPQQPGLDLQARIREEEDRRRREQEEAQRRQAAEQERLRAMQEQKQQQQQQQQQAGVQSQVELVLMERISSILENSWGRSDLASILATLHAEDSRVIPLLNNAEALRALILRNPRRVAIRQDPSFREEMAQLLITNSQWQQQQQQEQEQQQQQQQQQAQQQQQQALRQQQEELQRREQQRRMQEQANRAPQQVIPDAPWYYSDPSKNIQGPFRGEEMRQWLEAGYFKGDLPISQSQTGPFRPLSDIFKDLSAAFLNPQNAEAEARAKAEEQARLEAEQRARAEAAAAAERERHQQQELERQRQEAERQRQEKEAAEQRAREEEERARAEAEAAAAAAAAAAAKAAADADKSSNGRNESSTQLKMMLGLGSQGKAEAAPQASPPQAKPKKAPKKKASKEVAPAPVESSPISPKKTAAAAPSVWGGAAATNTGVKTMAQIQQEEARAAAVAAMNRQGTRSSSSGWANVAASRGGSTGWTGAVAAKPSPGVVLPVPSASQPGRAMSLQPGSTAAANAKSVAQSVPQRSTSVGGGADATADEFGAKMSPTLEKWCRDQMAKLNGTDDLTLVSFCMTLTDPDEIRQYLTAYLGATPQVTNFATEFISRKGGGNDKQDEWESTVPTKKGRKKKSGAR